MGVHPWPAIDPASAYMTMTGGAGAAPMHVASAAMSTLGGAVDSTVSASGVNTAATAANWSGLGGSASAASVNTLNTDQSVYGQLSLVKAQLLQAAGELHTMTPPRMVTHVQANANRGEYLVDNAINPLVWGALTPRLIDLDTEYFGYMWPNNASAGLSYGAGLDALGLALSSLSALPSLAGGSVAAPGLAAADVAANAGITMASATMSATEQAATATISPATSAGSQGSGLLGQEPLSAPSTPTSTPTVSPMANVTSHALPSPALSQAQAPAMGMFAPPSAAVINPSAPTPPVQTLSPSTGGAPGVASPGVTSFVKPVEPFTPPPMSSGGQAAGLSPGMLNASALRGPVTTAPVGTTALTQPLVNTGSLATATATQPLAYVPPDHPLPPAPLTPPQPPLLSPGDTAQSLTPPPQPQQAPPPPPHTPPQPQQQQPEPQPQPQPQAQPDPQPQPNPTFGAAPNQGVHNLSGDLKDSPGAQALSVQNNADVHKIVDPLPPGEHQGVKVLPTPQQIEDLYNQLTQNATPLPPGTYGKGLGKWATLPDGTRIGYRPDSKWGGPTVEIWDPGDSIPSVSVHLPERSTPEPQPAPEPAPQPHPVQPPVTQTPAPHTDEPVHDDSGHPSIHVDPPPPGVWATIVGILGVIGGVIGGIGEFAR